MFKHLKSRSKKNPGNVKISHQGLSTLMNCGAILLEKLPKGVSIDPMLTKFLG
jgi:hypothetical protein